MLQNESFVRLGALDKRLTAVEHSSGASLVLPQLKQLDDSATHMVRS